MNNPGTNENDLITRALRGQLSEAERRELDRRLQLDPALREAFELEQGLDHLLDHLPDAPLSSNFTSLVLQSVQSPANRRSATKTPWLRFRFARLATGLAVVTIAGVLSVHQYRKAEQEEMVRSVATFTEVASTMSPEQKPALVYKDFDAIERLAVPADAELDLELLVALQK